MLEAEGGGASTLPQQPAKIAEVTGVYIRGGGGRKGGEDTGEDGEKRDGAPYDERPG